MTDLTQDPFNDRPWMYSEPKGSSNHGKWVNEWLRVFLDVSEMKNIHLINKQDLRRIAPFDRLDDDTFDSLIEQLLDKDYLVYWGKGNLRVYWKTIQAWTDHMITRAKDLDRRVVFGLDAFRELDPVMGNLPSSDKVRILETAVDQGKARWMEKENNIIKIL